MCSEDRLDGSPPKKVGSSSVTHSSVDFGSRARLDLHCQLDSAVPHLPCPHIHPPSLPCPVPHGAEPWACRPGTHAAGSPLARRLLTPGPNRRAGKEEDGVPALCSPLAPGSGCVLPRGQCCPWALPRAEAAVLFALLSFHACR